MFERGHLRTFCLEVSGEYACFTRPEMKVERVSYDVVTPSAARGILEAIFWKPAVRWRVRRIDVLRPIRWTSVRRNEVNDVMREKTDGFFIEEKREQRAGFFLQDVAYRIHAELQVVSGEGKSKEVRGEVLYGPNSVTDAVRECAIEENPVKYGAIFERRARKGQCFHRPYLGCREFGCFFRLVEDPEEERRQKPPIPETRDLGFMLYDLDFSDPRNPQPAFFRARLQEGVLSVPAWESDEVRR